MFRHRMKRGSTGKRVGRDLADRNEKVLPSGIFKIPVATSIRFDNVWGMLTDLIVAQLHPTGLSRVGP